MTHRSQVPKFGNWDGDNVPYTAYFENARKEKAGGAAIMNPNDPEENPEAFMFGGFDGNGDLPPAISVETTELNQFTVGHEKYHHHHHLQISEAGDGYKRHRVHHQRNASDQQQKSSPRSDESKSSRSSLTVTQRQQQLNHRRKTSDGPKSFQSKSSSNSNGIAAKPSKGGRNPSEDLSSRSSSSSVPKFGDWDERDPKSGEGFTVIFNKVKEEKQISAAKFPPVQPDNSKNQETQRNEPRHKMFCCLF